MAIRRGFVQVWIVRKKLILYMLSVHFFPSQLIQTFISAENCNSLKIPLNRERREKERKEREKRDVVGTKDGRDGRDPTLNRELLASSKSSKCKCLSLFLWYSMPYGDEGSDAGLIIYVKLKPISLKQCCSMGTDA